MIIIPTRARSFIADVVSGNSDNTKFNIDNRFPIRMCVGWVIDGWRNSSSAVVSRFLSKQSGLEHRNLVLYAHCLEIIVVKRTSGISLYDVIFTAQ